MAQSFGDFLTATAQNDAVSDANAGMDPYELGVKAFYRTVAAAVTWARENDYDGIAALTYELTTPGRLVRHAVTYMHAYEAAFPAHV